MNSVDAIIIRGSILFLLGLVCILYQLILSSSSDVRQGRSVMTNVSRFGRLFFFSP